MAFPNLKAEMARNGISGAQMAAIAGVSEVTFSKWMNDKTEPTIAACFTIAKHLGKSVDYLFSTDPATQ